MVHLRRIVLGLPLVLWPVAGLAGGTPIAFTDPLTITNAFVPFQPGGVKVYTGRKEGAASVLVDLYLGTTRTFQVNGASVAARVLQETEFRDGDIEEISQNFLAQADDGRVFYFGELVDEYEHGAVTGHEGSWLVGGPTQPSDPPDTGDAPGPAVFMPAHPAVGDTFKPEDLLPIVDETDTVKKTGLHVAVVAGKFDDAIAVVETSQLPDSPPETKWYAAGVGVVKGKTRGERFVLVASTLRPR